MQISKNEFDSKPVYNKKILKTKIKPWCDKATDFHNKGTPKEGSNHTCLVGISSDSALKKDKIYYPQVVLK